MNYALFQGKTSFHNQQLQLVYGARIDDYSDVESHTSPRLGAIYKVNDRYTTKLLYGHAFRAPTALEREGSVQGVESNSEIEPEEIDTLEWVNVFHDTDYESEVTLFQSKWKEGIVLVPTTPPLNQYQNTGKNESYGIEVSSRTQLDDWLVQGSASYVRSENTDSDNEYLAFPNWIFNLQGSYRVPDQDMELTLKQRIMLDYSESDYLGSTRPEDSDDYFRTDFSVTKKIPHANSNLTQEFFLVVRNVFDQDNTIPSLYNAEGGLADYGRGINLGMRLSW